MKQIKILIVLSFMAFLFIACKGQIIEPVEVEYNWNGGYCELDGGRLKYDSVGSKYHYKCELCGKDYKFNQVMSYNE